MKELEIDTPTIVSVRSSSYGKNNKTLSFVWTLEQGARWVVEDNGLRAASFTGDQFKEAYELYQKI